MNPHEIVRRYQNRAVRPEVMCGILATENCCSSEDIRELLTWMGEHMPPKKRRCQWTEERVAEARRLYLEEGLSCREVATRLSVTENAVTVIFSKHGIYRKDKRRPAHELAR